MIYTKHIIHALSIFILLFCFSINGQSKNPDSLKLLLSTPKSDSNQVKLLKQLADSYYETSFDSMAFYYHRVLDLAPKVPYYSLELSTLRGFGYIYVYNKDDYEQSITYFEKALALTQSQNDTIGTAYVLADMGWNRWKKGMPLEALAFYLKVRDLAEEVNHAKLKFRACLELGIIQNENGDNKKAIDFYSKALMIADSANYTRSKAKVLNNLGKSHQDEKEYAIALSHFLEADSIFTALKDNNWLSLTNYNIGNNYLFRDLADKALPLYKKALSHNASINNKERMVMIMVGLAKAYQKNKDSQNSIKIANEALDTLETIDIESYYAELYALQAENYNSIGELGKATTFYKKHLDAVEVENLLNNGFEIANLQRLHETEKQERKALELNNKFLETENALVKVKARNQLLFFGLSFLFLGSLLLFFIFKTHELKRIDGLKTGLSAELHDNIGASLNHIKMLANQLNRLEPKHKEKQNILGKMKTISNQTIYDMYDMIWSLEKDKGTIGDLLIKMQDYADNLFGDFNIPYGFLVDGLQEKAKLNSKEKINCYSIFKESINNIIKHSKSEKVYISFEKQTEQFFKMTIKNSYCPKTQSQISGKNGISNMKKRAEAINGKLTIEQSESTFTLIFVL